MSMDTGLKPGRSQALSEIGAAFNGNSKWSFLSHARNESIGEDTRKFAKNTNGGTEMLCAAARPFADWQFASANRFSEVRQIALVTARFNCSRSGCAMSTNVASYLRKSTNVAPISFLWALFCEYPISFWSTLMETERIYCGHFTAFQLTSFKLSMCQRSGFSIRVPRLCSKCVPKATSSDPWSLVCACPKSPLFPRVREEKVA